MCTLTVIARDNGYYLAMNRDELLARGDAIPPSTVNLGTTTAIYPRDGAGGTWIAANSHGVALALLNWNDVPQPDKKTRSRGEVIPSLIGLASLDEVERALQKLDLRGVWPFRLVGVFPSEATIGEWRRNQHRLESHPHEWKPQHWFSSSLSDEKAFTGRSAVCKAAWNEDDAGSIAWLRRLHASHANGPGPFSLCVHRENVQTLSYTEISCDIEKIECFYAGATPCAVREFGSPTKSLRLS